MRLLYLAWKHGGACPYRLFNRLGDDFRPLEAPAEEPLPPAYPERLASVLYAFGLAAERDAVEMAAMRSLGSAGVA